MIARIKIEINLNEQEAIPFLRKNVVKLKNKSAFGLIENTATWKNLENPNNFRFELDTFGPFSPWWGKCKLKEIGNKTILKILILPPYIFLIWMGIVISGCIYAITKFGIHNYGTSGFLPSILLPSFALGIVFLIWMLTAKYNANKIKKDITSSFQSQLENENK